MGRETGWSCIDLNVSRKLYSTWTNKVNTPYAGRPMWNLCLLIKANVLHLQLTNVKEGVSMQYWIVKLACYFKNTFFVFKIIQHFTTESSKHLTGCFLSTFSTRKLAKDSCRLVFNGAISPALLRALLSAIQYPKLSRFFFVSHVNVFSVNLRIFPMMFSHATCMLLLCNQ